MHPSVHPHGGRISTPQGRVTKRLLAPSCAALRFPQTVFADLTVTVQAGMILAALLFISRVAQTTTVSQVTDDYIEVGRVHILRDKNIPYYDRLPDSCAVAVWGDGQDFGSDRTTAHPTAGGDRAIAKHDGTLCDWALRDRNGDVESDWEDLDSLRSSGAA